MNKSLVTTHFEFRKLDSNLKKNVTHLGDCSKDFGENFQNELLESKPKNIKEKKHCLEITEKIFENLYYHQKKFYKFNISKKGYGIILIPFLNNFVEILYKKYCDIEEKVKKNKNIKFQVLNSKDFVYFKNFEEFISFSQKDLFNFQIASEIINFNKYPNEKKIINHKFLKRIYLGFKQAVNTKIKDDYISERITFKKKLKEIVNIYKLDFRYSNFLTGLLKYKIPPKQSLDKKHFSNINLYITNQNRFLRSKILKIRNNNKIEKFIYSMVIKYLPSIYFESIKKNFITFDNKLSYVPKILISNAHGWWTDDLFKYYSGFCMSNKSIYIDIQHNGTYFIIKNNPHFEISKYFNNYFFGWGDACRINKKNFKLPVLYSIGKNKKINNKASYYLKKNKIIFMGASIKRFFGGYCQSYMDGGNSFSYYLNQLKFLNNISDDTIKKLILRLRHNEKDPRGYISYLKKKFKILKFEDIKTPAAIRLKKKDVAIIIVDHCSTPWLEALYCNKPMIIFWNNKENIINNRFLSIFSSLKKKKIYFDCPIAAAKRLEELIKKQNYDWWYKDTKIQNLRKKILKLFFYSNSKPIRSWNDGISKIFYESR